MKQNKNISNIYFTDEGREKALRFYKILAGLLGLLGIGLLTCGILAVQSKTYGGFGMPYFLGGFIVGIMVSHLFYNLSFISFLLCRLIRRHIGITFVGGSGVGGVVVGGGSILISLSGV